MGACDKPGTVHTTVIHDVGWLLQRHNWPSLTEAVVFDRVRRTPGAAPAGDKVEHETRLYITSLPLPAELIGPVVRCHWAIENSLHWVMDMTFRDDECRIRTEHAPASFNTLRHMACNLLRGEPLQDAARSAILDQVAQMD
jgi:hypothetical protein